MPKNKRRNCTLVLVWLLGQHDRGLCDVCAGGLPLPSAITAEKGVPGKIPRTQPTMCQALLPFMSQKKGRLLLGRCLKVLNQVRHIVIIGTSARSGEASPHATCSQLCHHLLQMHEAVRAHLVQDPW